MQQLPRDAHEHGHDELRPHEPAHIAYDAGCVAGKSRRRLLKRR